ncbi:MAG: DUF3854 domain-containing protein [Cyanobacteria bacterium P01_A01_bin.37]
MLTLASVHERAIDEWVQGSGIDLELAKLNIKSSNLPVEGKRLTGWRAFAVGEGYWWCNTIEPRTGTEYERGELKFFLPPKKNNKDIKYVTYPSATSPPPGLMKVPMAIWEAVASRNGISHSTITIDNTRDDDGFWQWVIDQRLTIYICEGRKKAAALLTHGYVSISVNGVWNGTKKSHKADHRRIIDGLTPFLQSEAEVCLTYDADFRSNPQVMEALKSFNATLKNSCSTVKVSVATWGVNEGKGIDDLLVNHGADRLHEIMKGREGFDEWIGSIIFDPTFEDQVLNRIIETSPHKWIYVNREIHAWTGTHYKAIPDEEVEHILYEHLKGFKDPDGDKEGQSGAANSKWSKRVRDQIKIRFYVRSSQLNPVGHFNLLNTVIKVTTDIEEKTVWWEEVERSHDSEPYFDYCREFKWDPSAQPLHWNKIKSALDEPYRSILFKTIAASIDLSSVRKIHGRGTRCLFLLGGGNNGKDTPKKIVDQIFGLSVTSISMSEIKNADTNGDCNHLWPLEFSRLNWSTEAKTVRLDKNDILKAILTGESMRIRRMRQDGKLIDPACVMIFTSNNDPVVATTAEAVKSRFGMIRFNKVFKDNPHKSNELQADPRYKYDPQFLLEKATPAAFLDLLRMYKSVIEEGIDYSPLDATYAEIQDESSHLNRFVQDIELIEDEDNQIPLSILWEQLKRWYIIEEMITINDGTIRPTCNDKYDPVIVNNRQIKKRLSEINPRMKVESIKLNGTARQSVLTGWKINNPLTISI